MYMERNLKVGQKNAPLHDHTTISINMNFANKEYHD